MKSVTDADLVETLCMLYEASGAMRAIATPQFPHNHLGDMAGAWHNKAHTLRLKYFPPDPEEAVDALERARRVKKEEGVQRKTDAHD
jgi:hypothetical protein